MEILELASQLGLLIADNELVKNYVEAKKEYDTDSELLKSIREYSVQKTALDNVLKDENHDEQLVNAIQKRISALYKEASENETLKEYNDAEQKLNDLLSQVNNTIQSAIFSRYPEMSSGCGGNCSSCGGCH